MSCDHPFACGTCNDRITRTDDVHAETVAAVRRRAEKAEAEVARLRSIAIDARDAVLTNDSSTALAILTDPDVGRRGAS